MSDTISTFIDAMRAHGVGPARAADIKADDKWHSYQIEGDRPGVKKGAYRLKVEGDGFGVGNYGSHREGIWHVWNSKAPQRFTPEEKKAWKERIDRERAQADATLKQEQDAVARSAKLHWDTLGMATADHPYLTRKRIKPHGTRLFNDALVVPMYGDGRMCGYQTITATGDKMFLKSARLKGAYMTIASKDDDKSRLVICEGFATGASIREATRFPVIIAFNAGNLEPVAKYFREKYPEAQIILCADNDQWTWDGAKKAKHCPKDLITADIEGDDPRWKNWRAVGYLRNIGREKADQAAAAIGGAHVIWPEFPEDDADRATDFNDLHVREGLEAVRDRILNIPKPQQPDVPKPVPVTYDRIVTSENFWDQLRVKSVDQTGTRIKYDENSLNYSMIVEWHPRLRGIFAWDEFHVSTVVLKCPPWLIDQGREHEFKVHELNPIDVRECDYFIQRCHGNMRGSIEKTESAIDDAANRNKINPVRDYYDGLTWDGQPRLDTWLIDYLGCTKDDRDYVRAVGRTWIMGMIMRGYEPGRKFDHMLILEGPQAAGKSTALRTIATIGEGSDARSYFCDNFKIANCDDTDELLKTRGTMIIEIQEMAGFNKRDDETLKAFITQQEDQYRAPYGRKTEKWPRRFVLAGTYNPVEGIFKDPTGLRRYWVVGTGKEIDNDGLRQARQQILAEAVHRYKAGESLVLSKELYKKAEYAANERRIVDDMTHEVLGVVRGLPFVEVRQVMMEMGIPVRGKSQSESRSISKILMIEGWQRKQRRVAGRNVWGWEAPELGNLTPVYENNQVEIDWSNTPAAREGIGLHPSDVDEEEELEIDAA